MIPPEPTHAPLMAKHPVVMLKPTLDVEVADPEMFKPESVVVPKPSAATVRNVVATDDEAIWKSGAVWPAVAETESLAYGEVEPTPTLPPWRSAKTVSLSAPYNPPPVDGMKNTDPSRYKKLPHTEVAKFKPGDAR